VQNLIQSKLNLEVPASDIASCRHTNSGLVFRLGNFQPGASFWQVVQAIKSGCNRDVPLFFNFALTRHRSALLYEVRQLKKVKKIHKFFTDYDGQITIKREAEGRKEKLCAVGSKDNQFVRTSTVAELRELLQVGA
jgi:hypothetical protein